jgi:DNA invertase Pin-like site-specific DNA recombinase
MTRRLSDLGVTVRFEREGLDTGSMDGELMLGILAAIAQEESASISSNIQ